VDVTVINRRDCRALNGIGAVAKRPGRIDNIGGVEPLAQVWAAMDRAKSCGGSIAEDGAVTYTKSGPRHMARSRTRPLAASSSFVRYRNSG
jgi:hypothetical protein